MNTFQKFLVGGAMLGTTMIGGAVGASVVGTAGAQTTTSTTAAATTPTTAADSGASGTTGTSGTHASKGPHQANGITETPLTGDDLTKATAAAEAAVPGGTVERAETDAEGAVYEVHMTKADGSDVTVKLDASFSVTGTVDGHG